MATHYSLSWQTNQFCRYISELERERVQYFQRVFVNVSNRLKKTTCNKPTTRIIKLSAFYSILKRIKVPFVFAIIGMIGYSAVDTFVFSQLQPMIDESLGKNDHDYLRLAAYAIVPLFFVTGCFQLF